jgi:hypothetical protein
MEETGLAEKSVPYNTVNCCTVTRIRLKNIRKQAGLVVFRIVPAGNTAARFVRNAQGCFK